MEIERKFLLSDVPSEIDGLIPVELRQGYVVATPGAEVRLRDAAGVWSLAVKTGSGMVRGEYEVELTREQFENLWPATVGRRLEKRRYTLPVGDLRYEVDVYTGALAGLVVAEVEFASREQAEAFEPPAWFGPDVTADAAYKNASLALAAADGDAP